eukprot:3617304-Rhodomonas_salina.1
MSNHLAANQTYATDIAQQNLPHEPRPFVGAVLKRSDVAEIFLQRPSRGMDVDGKNTFKVEDAASPTLLGLKYGVSSKTIRDIWNRNTWHSVTRPLWNAAEMAAEGDKINGVVAAEKRKQGRPKGSKDAVKRNRGGGKRTLESSSSCESLASLNGSQSGAAEDFQCPAKKICLDDITFLKATSRESGESSGISQMESAGPAEHRPVRTTLLCDTTTQDGLDGPIWQHDLGHAAPAFTTIHYCDVKPAAPETSTLETCASIFFEHSQADLNEPGY